MENEIMTTTVQEVQEDLLADVYSQMKETTPGTKEYTAILKDFVELSKAHNEEIETNEKLAIERKKAKSERIQGWAKIGTTILTTAAYVGTGIVMLKYNLQEGNLQGRDASKWFDQLKTIIKH